jgi:peptidoglycan hydrolase CwlO-like protein
MNNDEKILKALEQQGKTLEALQADVTNIKREAATKSDVHHLVQGQAQFQTDVAQIKTGVEAVKAGLDDVRDRMAQKQQLWTRTQS